MAGGHRHAIPVSGRRCRTTGPERGLPQAAGWLDESMAGLPLSNGRRRTRERLPDLPGALRHNAFTFLDRNSEFVAIVSGPRRPVPLTKRAAAVTIWSG